MPRGLKMNVWMNKKDLGMMQNKPKISEYKGTN